MKLTEIYKKNKLQISRSVPFNVGRNLSFLITLTRFVYIGLYITRVNTYSRVMSDFLYFDLPTEGSQCFLDPSGCGSRSSVWNPRRDASIQAPRPPALVLRDLAAEKQFCRNQAWIRLECARFTVDVLWD